MQASLIAAAANIALNYVFIGMFGYVAAGYTTLFCYILYAIGHYVVSRRVLRLENESATSIVNTKAVVFAIRLFRSYHGSCDFCARLYFGQIRLAAPSYDRGYCQQEENIVLYSRDQKSEVT